MGHFRDSLWTGLWSIFFLQTESLFTGYFREYAPGLGMVLYLHVNAFFYPPIHCGTKSFFILLKHYFALATSRTYCHVYFSPSGRKEATNGTMSTLISERYPKSSIFFNVWRHNSNRPLGPYSVRREYRELPWQFDQLVVSVASVFRTSGSCWESWNTIKKEKWRGCTIAPAL